ncbi:hypothetical protein LHYA1_G004826 [Lachnellula hyalina]|uniref:DUF2470 domain-containing protein n=1 Tax=Lachnellula hyalina TaxID=1316788 RepID=A0A8H8TY61_9HELO|nr:uncharacterized protein LHYA1_G004826 [Lachnellula hyalina]TVY26799.1 hypothetical protein LHYA1_G004826 [Lachnellula hyalina]
MADQAAKDAAMKQRIISHLNAGHQDSLSYYLRHYSQLSSRAARSPTLTDLSLSSMTLQTADGKTHTIPITPPMKSYAEARQKSVDMDRESRAALDISSIRITSYQRPRSALHIFIFGLCGMAFTFFATRHRIVPGTWFYDNALPWFPGGPEWFHWACKALFAPTLLLHFFEAFMLDRTRLRKYGVERGSVLWFKWIVSAFVEGFATFQRIDAMVKREELEAEKAKH